jgi:carboxymethylenebutenolidase
MPSHDITIATLDGGSMPAYLATPDADGPWPVAVVLGELFGLTDVQRDAADRVSALGYVAVAPHLLHRRAGTEPLPEDEQGRRRGLELIQVLSRLELVSDVRDALEAAGIEPQADRSLGAVAVGMSFGGHVAVLAAALLELSACVGMYAGWLAGTEIAAARPQPTGSLPLSGRLMLLGGEQDQMVPASDLETLRNWHPDAEIVTYPGAGHRFCSIDRPGFDAEVAADAWARIANFLSAPA